MSERDSEILLALGLWCYGLLGARGTAIVVAVLLTAHLLGWLK